MNVLLALRDFLLRIFKSTTIPKWGNYPCSKMGYTIGTILLKGCFMEIKNASATPATNALLENLEKYISPCGGAKLTLDDVAVINGYYTTRNENGQLFLAYLNRAYKDNVEANKLLGRAFLRLMLNTDVGYGKYSRRPGDSAIIRQSHDNIIGIAWLSMKHDLIPIIRIYNYARWRLWNYCINGWWDYRCQLQGSTVFVIKLAAGIKPGWLSTIWWAGSMVVSDHSADGYMRKMLQVDIVEARSNLLSKLKKRVVDWAIDIHTKRREDVRRWYWAYYHEDSNNPALHGEYY